MDLFKHTHLVHDYGAPSQQTTVKLQPYSLTELVSNKKGSSSLLAGPSSSEQIDF